MARTDDIINVSGHRLSTGQLEEACLAHPDVVECAVIGVEDSLKGSVPLAFLVVAGDNDADTCEAVVKEVSVVQHVFDLFTPPHTHTHLLCIAPNYVFTGQNTRVYANRNKMWCSIGF